MAAPPVSVVVASQGRPSWLARCLTALGQLDYPAFEVIVAADAAGLAAVGAHRLGGRCKTVRAATPNISETRNAGIALAAGELVAFIDDDAVPEPLWLHHHTQAIADTGAAASLGYVRGRNGISFQSRAVSIDGAGESRQEVSAEQVAAVPTLSEGRALKLIGTNFTIRRDVLLALGGFDPAYCFFLDDSDLSMRFAAAGGIAAVAPLAEVHHATAASERRTAHRFPRRLFDIGRSTAIFVKRHRPEALAEVFEQMQARERHRLITHLVRGTCEPGDIAPGLDDLMRGWRAGSDFERPAPAPIKIQNIEFKQFSENTPTHQLFSARYVNRRATLRHARAAVAAGGAASVISLSLTPVRHQVRYTDDGIWLQTGGVFGRSVRKGPRVRWCTFARRVKAEAARVELQRGIGNNGTRVG